MNKKTHVVTMAVLILVIAGACFWGGTKYQQNKTFSGFQRQFETGNGPGLGQGVGRNGINNTDGVAKNRGQTPGFRQTIGEIINIDDKSITIKLTDGSSKIILLSDTTTISQSTTASKSDLKVGTKIMVNGDTNTDGSVTSRNIEINPAFATITPTAKQ